MQNMLTEKYLPPTISAGAIFSHLFIVRVWPFILLEPQHDVLGAHF